MKSLNLGVTFLLELAMLAAFAVWGFSIGSTTAAKILLGIGVPVVVGVFWGLFMAPKARRRLPEIPYLIVKVLLFAAAAVGLIGGGWVAPGVVLAVIFVINTVLLYALK